MLAWMAHETNVLNAAILQISANSSSVPSLQLKGLKMAEAYYDLKKASDGQFYFNLVAPNGEPVATSEMYPTKSNAKRGIDAVRRAASAVKIEDNT